ncbi:MAG TPA: HEAT repeat domain-containing protein [Gemmatimonadaceae bacterium]|nr:HEAT repeat domain-containing protein [Gemmatimonadaceae bacterium]
MDITYLPSRLEPLFLGALVITAILWIALSAYVVINRMLYDRRQRRLMEDASDLSEPAVASLPMIERSPAMRRALSNLSRQNVYRLVSRTDVPAALNEFSAAYATEYVGADQISRDASSDSRRRKWRRISALFALADLKAPDAHEQLANALADPDVDVANAAAVVLRRVGDRRAASILIAALRRGTPAPSRVATHLDQFPLPIHDLIRPLLVDPQPHARQWAASLLMRYPDVSELAAEVAEVADDESPSVRKAALLTLGAMASAVAVPTAERRLADPVSYVRSTAIRVLARHGTQETDDARRQAIASWIAPSLADSAWEVRAAAKESLVELGPTTWRKVATQLESPDEFARNSAAEVLQNLGMVDATVRELPTSTTEVVDVVSRALREGGSAMAGAAALRSAPETRGALEDLLRNHQEAGVQP